MKYVIVQVSKGFQDFVGIDVLKSYLARNCNSHFIDNPKSVHIRFPEVDLCKVNRWSKTQFKNFCIATSGKEIKFSRAKLV